MVLFSLLGSAAVLPGSAVVLLGSAPNLIPESKKAGKSFLAIRLGFGRVVLPGFCPPRPVPLERCGGENKTREEREIAATLQHRRVGCKNACSSLEERWSIAELALKIHAPAYKKSGTLPS